MRRVCFGDHWRRTGVATQLRSTAPDAVGPDHVRHGLVVAYDDLWSARSQEYAQLPRFYGASSMERRLPTERALTAADVLSKADSWLSARG